MTNRRPPDAAQRPPAAAEACITCSDVAAPMRVLAVDGETMLATCRAESGEEVTVDVGVVPAARAGDLLLVHAGTALQALAEEPA